MKKILLFLLIIVSLTLVGCTNEYKIEFYIDNDIKTHYFKNEIIITDEVINEVIQEEINGLYYDEKYILNSDAVPRCKKCNGIIKPDVVLYEEGLNQDIVRGAIEAISEAELLIIIGTSLAVYPAASFISYFRGGKIALINKNKTDFDKKADIVIYDDIVNVIEKLEG